MGTLVWAFSIPTFLFSELRFEMPIGFILGFRPAGIYMLIITTYIFRWYCGSSYTNTAIPAKSGLRLHSYSSKTMAFRVYKFKHHHRSGAKDQPVMLLNNNLVSLSEALPFSELPITIKNAIRITQQLQIPILWVDSLCIIQDSKEDKRKEIRNMKNIYGKSHITLVASSAATCEIGFLQTRLEILFPAFPIPIKCFDSLGTVFIQP